RVREDPPTGGLTAGTEEQGASLPGNPRSSQVACGGVAGDRERAADGQVPARPARRPRAAVSPSARRVRRGAAAHDRGALTLRARARPLPGRAGDVVPRVLAGPLL